MSMPAATADPITFISRHAPYGRDNAFACLDMVLAFAVFETQVNYFFLEDGVYQLLDGQQADAIGQKPFGAALQALDLYGVKNIYVDQASLLQRSLSPDNLVIAVKLIDDQRAAQLIAESRCVFIL
jgi:tRNA 2-thiouridine synthesizing protein C